NAKALGVSTRKRQAPLCNIEIDDRSPISRLYDKKLRSEVFPAGELANRLVVFEDKPLNFDAWDIDAYFYTKSRDVDRLEAAEVRESGPERAVLQLTWRIGEQSVIVQRTCVYARLPRIDFQNQV